MISQTCVQQNHNPLGSIQNKEHLCVIFQNLVHCRTKKLIYSLTQTFLNLNFCNIILILFFILVFNYKFQLPTFRRTYHL